MPTLFAPPQSSTSSSNVSNALPTSNNNSSLGPVAAVPAGLCSFPILLSAQCLLLNKAAESAKVEAKERITLKVVVFEARALKCVQIRKLSSFI